jgi:hypothetical protein
VATSEAALVKDEAARAGRFRRPGAGPVRRDRNRNPAADGPVTSVAFTPDGQYVISGSTDGKAVLWNLDTAPSGAAVMDLARAAGNDIAVAARDDNTFITVDKLGQVLLWDIEATSLIAHACAIVGRNLTPAEWKEVLPDRRFQETCPR